MKIFKKLLFSFIYPSGDQDVNPGCYSFSALLGSKVIISSDCKLSSHLYPQVHHGDPAQDGDPAVHCYCLLDQVANHHILYLITFFIFRVVLFLFPFIHAIGQVILIVRRLSNNCVLFSEPSDLCRNEQVVQELFIQDDEGVVLQDGEQGGQHHEHRK